MASAAGLSVPQPQVDTPVATHTSVGRGAPPIVAPPMSGRVHNLFVFPEGGVAAQTRDQMVMLPDGQVLLSADRRAENAAPGPLICNVGPAHRTACIRSTKLLQNGKYLGSQLMVLDSEGGNRMVASVGSRGTLDADGIAFDSSGTILYAYSLSDTVGNTAVQATRLVRGNRQMELPWRPEHGALEDLGGGGRVDPPIRFFDFRGRTHMLYHSGRTLLLAPMDRPGAAIKVADRSAYDARPIEGGDGMLYVFYYEPKSRTARVARSSDGLTFSDLVLDTKESGWQLDAIPTDEGAIAVYYYFRNTYNKGLRIAALHGGMLAHAPASLMREDRWNSGWHMNLASDHGHDVWLTYLSNIETDTRVWSRFGAPKELLDYAVKDTGTMEDNYKNWFLQAGAGGWYTFWSLRSKAPDASELDGPRGVHDARYGVDPSMLVSANLEARFGPVDVGLSYAQNYLDREVKKLESSTGVLAGQVKIDDLLPGHDVKAEGLWGRYHGSVSRDDDAGVAEQVPLDANYVDIHLFALNQWRIKYGLGFSNYSVPTPIQAYSAGAKQTHYNFATSEIRNVHYNDIDLALGYSKLDYLAKYENNYFGPVADITASVGVTLATFDSVATPVGTVENASSLHLRGDVRLGWLWMDRFRALSGLGLYVRPYYVFEGALSGGLDRPKDRETKDADNTDTKATFSLVSLRHGPWLDAGVVW